VGWLSSQQNPSRGANVRQRKTRSTGAVVNGGAGQTVEMKPMNNILGVDPGATGALALMENGRIHVWDMPTVAGDINIDELVRIVSEINASVAVIERASARPGQGVSSTFRYGQGYGALRAVIGLCKIPSHLVTPAKWKRHFSLDADKEKSRALAIRLWPGCGLFNLKKHHGRAEAALIAKFGAEVLR
jgi:hypothetical protein